MLIKRQVSDYTGGPNDHDQLLAAEASDDGGESDASVSTLSSTSAPLDPRLPENKSLLHWWQSFQQYTDCIG